MAVYLHLSEHRSLGSVACLFAALNNVVEKRYLFSILADWSCHPLVHRIMFGCRMGCLLICLT